MNGFTTIAVTTGTISNCANAGVRIDVGIDVDKADMESGEIDQTACNGNDGTNGTVGSPSPETMLTFASNTDASLGCTSGGREIVQGLDNGDGNGIPQNGILEDDEVDLTTILCSSFKFELIFDLLPHSVDGSIYSLNFVDSTIYFAAQDPYPSHGFYPTTQSTGQLGRSVISFPPLWGCFRLNLLLRGVTFGHRI